MARVLSFLIRYFSNYYTLHRSDLAARAAPLDPPLRSLPYCYALLLDPFFVSFAYGSFSKFMTFDILKYLRVVISNFEMFLMQGWILLMRYFVVHFSTNFLYNRFCYFYFNPENPECLSKTFCVQ